VGEGLVAGAGDRLPTVGEGLSRPLSPSPTPESPSSTPAASQSPTPVSTSPSPAEFKYHTAERRVCAMGCPGVGEWLAASASNRLPGVGEGLCRPLSPSPTPQSPSPTPAASPSLIPGEPLTFTCKKTCKQRVWGTCSPGVCEGLAGVGEMYFQVGEGLAGAGSSPGACWCG
jgi:hypothetical protein